LGKRTQNLIYCLLSGLLPLALFGFSTGPPIKRTGAPSDENGTTCAACHNSLGAANSDPAGSVKIEAGSYKPGIPQIIKVTVHHPQSMRWGFQLTARPVSDETKMAGSFTPDANVRVRCDPAGAAAPCSGALEFAEHTEPGTRIGASGSATFEVQWTPPASEVGDVVFYAAGNAANGNGANTGDRIYTTKSTVSSAGACGLTKRPNLRAVADAAALKPGLAMNSLLSIFGTDFQVAGSSRTAGAGDFVAGAFPKQLGCIAVEVAGQRAPVTYVQFDQINAQVPTLTQTGNVNVMVIANPGQPNELRSDLGTVSLQNYAPALFTFNGTSVAALNAVTGAIIANPTLFASGVPAKPGEFISLYGTGFGATDPVYQAGELTRSTPVTSLRAPIGVTVSVGGTTLPASDILFVGAAPGLISGLYQINIRIPATVADGDIPVSVQIGGVTSPAGTTIPVKR
jgi:uncharacterized protein (TIGR03437 family)